MIVGVKRISGFLGYLLGGLIGYLITISVILPPFIDIAIMAYCSVVGGFIGLRLYHRSQGTFRLPADVFFYVSILALLGALFCNHFPFEELTQHAIVPLAGAGFIINISLLLMSWKKQTKQMHLFYSIIICISLMELVWVAIKMKSFSIF